MLYLDRDKTLDELVKGMAEEHGFYATYGSPPQSSPRGFLRQLIDTWAGEPSTSADWTTGR